MAMASQSNRMVCLNKTSEESKTQHWSIGNKNGKIKDITQRNICFSFYICTQIELIERWYFRQENQHFHISYQMNVLSHIFTHFCFHTYVGNSFFRVILYYHSTTLSSCFSFVACLKVSVFFADTCISRQRRNVHF